MTVQRRLILEDKKIHIAMKGDVEELVKSLAEKRSAARTEDMHHKWSLDTVMVNKFYSDYCGYGPPRPMNAEFWAYVDKKMEDPQYSKFWASDRAAQAFRVGWGQ